jgi:hypothetical protein
MKPIVSQVVSVILVASLPGQQMLWEIHSTTGTFNNYVAPRFGDYNHDGYDDLLIGAIVNYGTLQQYQTIRVLSGLDGSLLDEHPPMQQFSNLVGVGDFDRDGYPDYCYVWNNAFGIFLEVWSPHLHTVLMSTTGQPGWGWGFALAGNLDFNRDGLPDLLVSGGDSNQSVLYAYDHSGAVGYSIPARSLGFVVRSLAAVGDLDGDGADDYIVGGTEFGSQRGAVILVSGLTGTPLRLHFGPRSLGLLGDQVWSAGDMDGDGVTDYAAGNNFGVGGGIVMAWSGATGGLIRQWLDPYLTGILICGRDIDLDGFTDIIDSVPGYPNAGGSTLQGRVRTLSSRDGQDLVNVASQQWTTDFGQYISDLGVQPGNPYPVFAVMDTPVISGNSWPRIRVWRASPAGTRFTGTGCSSSGAIPTIGVRRVAAAVGEDSRIVLGSAPVASLALCVVAPGAATSGGGIAVPLPLDPFGLTGCSLLVPPVLTGERLTGIAGMDRGYAEVGLSPALVPVGGSSYAAQWIVLDPTTFAYATTSRLEFSVQ